MAVRHNFDTTKTLTIAGTDFLGDIKMVEHDVSITSADGRGDGRYSIEVETKRTSTVSFTYNAGDTPERNTALTVTAFDVGSMDLLGDFKNFTMNLTNNTKDGSGGRDRDSFANFTGGSKLSISGLFLVSKTVLQVEAITTILSDDSTDRVLTCTVDYGDESVSGSWLVTQCKLAWSTDELLAYDMTILNRGTPTATPGTTFFGKAIAGTGANALYTIVHDTGAGILTHTNTRLVSMSCSVADSQITTMSVTAATAGKPTWVTST